MCWQGARAMLVWKGGVGGVCVRGMLVWEGEWFEWGIPHRSFRSLSVRMVRRAKWQ